MVGWQKAILLWLQDKVEILEYHADSIRSARQSFQLPSVMRLKSYIRPRPHKRIKFSRENVYLRDNYTCQYCRIQFPSKELTLDHVIPASKSGAKSWTNVVTACRACNHRKGNRTPQLARMPLMAEPYMPDWLPSYQLQLKRSQVPDSWRMYLFFSAEFDSPLGFRLRAQG